MIEHANLLISLELWFSKGTHAERGVVGKRRLTEDKLSSSFLISAFV